MLDKSIPYQNIIMCAERENLLCLKEPNSLRKKRRLIIFLKITWLLKHYCGSAVGLFGMKKKIRRRQLRRPGLNR